MWESGLKRGETYTFTSGPDRHLYIVVSDSSPASDDIVVVNLTTERGWPDTTCVLKKGEHWKVDHDSIVLYEKAKLVKNCHLDACIANGTIKRQGPMKHGALKKITEGFGESPYTPRRCREKLESLGLL